MNPYLERTMFTSKSTADFAMQSPFKVRSTQEEMSRYQFFTHFTLKELCTAKSTQALDANRPLSKYSELNSLNFRMMYSNIGLSFCEIVPLNVFLYNFWCYILASGTVIENVNKNKKNYLFLGRDRDRYYMI